MVNDPPLLLPPFQWLADAWARTLRLVRTGWWLTLPSQSHLNVSASSTQSTWLTASFSGLESVRSSMTGLLALFRELSLWWDFPARAVAAAFKKRFLVQLGRGMTFELQSSSKGFHYFTTLHSRQKMSMLNFDPSLSCYIVHLLELLGTFGAYWNPMWFIRQPILRLYQSGGD